MTRSRLAIAALSGAIVTASSISLVGAADTRKDIPGWAATKWGMGVAEIKQLYPEFTIGKDRFGLTAGVIPIELDQQPFKAYLEFQNVGGKRETGDTSPEPPQSEWKLATVELWLETDDNKAVWTCESIATSLRGKYGDPTKSFSGGKTLWWVMPTTTIIKIANEGVPGTQFKPSCWIRYLPSQVSGSDKL